MNSLILSLARLQEVDGSVRIEKGVVYLEDGSSIDIKDLLTQAVNARVFLKESKRILGSIRENNEVSEHIPAQMDRLTGYIDGLVSDLCQHTYHHLISDGGCCALCGEPRE